MYLNWTAVSNVTGYTLYWCRRTLDYSPTGDKCTNNSAVRHSPCFRDIGRDGNFVKIVVNEVLCTFFLFHAPKFPERATSCKKTKAKL